MCLGWLQLYWWRCFRNFSCKQSFSSHSHTFQHSVCRDSTSDMHILYAWQQNMRLSEYTPASSRLVVEPTHSLECAGSILFHWQPNSQDYSTQTRKYKSAILVVNLSPTTAAWISHLMQGWELRLYWCERHYWFDVSLQFVIDSLNDSWSFFLCLKTAGLHRFSTSMQLFYYLCVWTRCTNSLSVTIWSGRKREYFHSMPLLSFSQVFIVRENIC